MDVTDSRHGPHRHIDFVYVRRPIGGHLTAQLNEVTAAEWVPLPDLPRLDTPVELPELVTAAARWAAAAPADQPATAGASARHEASP